MASKGKETEDDIYCACLSKALCQVATPVTVGLYAPFGGRVYMLLDRITKCMREEASRITEKEETTLKQTTVKPHGLGFMHLLWRLLFYCPVVTSAHLERKSIQFIFVHFSAWQYAGSDRLWAGLVTTLCDQIRRHFGILPLSVFNVLGSAPKRNLEEDVKEWTFKRTFCIVLVVTFILLLIGLLLLTVPINSSSHEGKEKVSTVFGSLATVLAGSGIAMTLYKICKSVLISQKQKIERLVNSQKFSSQMGFMNEVKKEVELITQMVQYMEIFQKQKIRVVLQITSLELCAPDKVVGVLDAMNTLLSDQRSPFISILVVDPSIIVTCLESAGSLKGMADNGYMFLNRTVTLPFSVPSLGKKTKLQLLRKAVQRTEDLIDWPCRNDANRGTKTGITESMKLLREELSEDDEAEIGMPIYQPAYCIQEAFYALYSEREVLHEYIPDSICQMKRIVNAIPVMVHLMMLSKIPWGKLSSKSVAAWVVLCNQWPCRLSWILQCLEDEEQQGSKEGFSNSLLWDVFKQYSKELFAMKAGLKNLLDLDGDPEIFQRFLSKDFPFTVEESRRLIKCTINLDSSMKNKMGLLRGINSLQNDWKDTEDSNNKTEKEAECNNDGKDKKETVGEGDPDCSKEAEKREIDRTTWKKASWFNLEVYEDIGEGSMRGMQEKVFEGVAEEPTMNIHTTPTSEMCGTQCDCRECKCVNETLRSGIELSQDSYNGELLTQITQMQKDDNECIIQTQKKAMDECIEDNQLKELSGKFIVVQKKEEESTYEMQSQIKDFPEQSILPTHEA
ncbi:PREDICTED: NTPase KAP family P-loop domain-containing protein 1 [Nanorana parkeri]|uniref:NTPase KAP family P-loop domain-containing protein 1 n=1 Tax=Nanorana parkeri TaxID=125878 RepID=UPI00085447B1|nr:PREDICTED: NTPase KAP family P-loop domain-containing protein 1 [Nanorana parkeri]